MYKGFKIEELNFNNKLDHYYDIGIEMFEGYKTDIQKSLKTFLFIENSLDGTKIIDNWFPNFKANVFLSHSHKDEKTAIAFAGWLYENFNIITFIDSCIWGYTNELIKMLDDEYSWLDKESGLYEYGKVMSSTSHVHMMLSTALSRMIDKTECLMFYNTPNSVKSFGSKDRTESPWIYSEIMFSQITRLTIPKRINQLIRENRTFSALEGDPFQKALSISYDLDSIHLIELPVSKLIDWQKYSELHKKEYALDKLYEIAFPRIDLID